MVNEIKRRIELNPKKSDYISIYLDNFNIKLGKYLSNFINIPSKIIFYLRGCENYSFKACYSNKIF